MNLGKKKLIAAPLGFVLALAINAPAFASPTNNGPPICPPGLAYAPGLNGNAQANNSFSACLAVNGTVFQLPFQQNPQNAKQAVIGSIGSSGISPLTITNRGVGAPAGIGPPLQWQVDLTQLSDQDPFINFGILAQTFPGFGPQTFTIAFLTPLVPPVGANTVSGQFTATLIDASFSNGASLIPILPNLVVSTVSADGSNFTTLGVNLGSSLAIPSTGGPPVTASGAAGPQAGPNPPSGQAWNFLQTIVSFTVSGDGDIASVTGQTTLTSSPTPTPEPGTLLLIGSGLVGIGVGARRRKRK